MTQRLLVRDLMTVGVSTCSPDTPITDLARLFLEKNLEGVIVLDHEGHAVGIVSQDDLIRVYARDDHRTLVAENAMSAAVPQFPPDIPLAAAAQLMRDQGIRIAFMMHNANGIIYPAAVLTYRHILRHLAANDDSELEDLGIKASRTAPLDTFFQRRDEARRQSQYPQQE